MLRKATTRWLGTAQVTLLALALVAALIAACGQGASPTPTPVTGEWRFDEGFEEGLGEWKLGADVPADGERPNQTVEWSIEASKEQSKSGQASARLFLDGKHDDGTIWITRSFEVPANQAYAAHISLDLWSPSESFNTLGRVAAYAGPRQPVEEADFDTRQAADQAEGWKRYEYQMDTRSDDAGQLWVALGISVVWETKVTYFIDDVSIEIMPS